LLDPAAVLCLAGAGGPGAGCVLACPGGVFARPGGVTSSPGSFFAWPGGVFACPGGVIEAGRWRSGATGDWVGGGDGDGLSGTVAGGGVGGAEACFGRSATAGAGCKATGVTGAIGVAPAPGGSEAACPEVRWPAFGIVGA
jgi:hypothetical protein